MFTLTITHNTVYIYIYRIVIVPNRLEYRLLSRRDRHRYILQQRHGLFLVTVSTNTPWEVDYSASNGAQTISDKPKAPCVRCGIPDTTVSDNGPQYNYHAFARLCESWDMTHVTSSTRYCSKAKGKDVSAMHTCKQIIGKCNEI